MKYRFLDPKKMLDWWSVPHFLFGMVTALVAMVFSVPVFHGFLATLYLAIFWELLEKRYRLSEAPGNAPVDILLPLLAFGMTFLLVGQSHPEPDRVASLLVVIFLLYMAVNFFSWRARFERDQEFLG